MEGAVVGILESADVSIEVGDAGEVAPNDVLTVLVTVLDANVVSLVDTTNRLRVKPEVEGVGDGISSSTFASIVQSPPSSSIDVGTTDAVEGIVDVVIEGVDVIEGVATLVDMSIVHSGSSSSVLVGLVDGTETEESGVSVGEDTALAKDADIDVAGVAVLLPKRLASTPACCILSNAPSCVSQAMVVPSLVTNGRAAQMRPDGQGCGTHAPSTH